MIRLLTVDAIARSNAQRVFFFGLSRASSWSNEGLNCVGWDTAR